MADFVSDITEEINSVEKKSEKRMTALEKQLSLNNRKLENEVRVLNFDHWYFYYYN